MVTLSYKDQQIAPPEPSRINDPGHWRDRAEEARVKAAQMADLSAIATMTWVANEYDRLARWAEAGRQTAS
jgi:hypothetical protein